MSAREFKAAETVDFVVVGTGAAGGVIARELSTAGFSVLAFEQGPRLSPADFEHDELKYFFLNGLTLDPAVSPQSFRKTASGAGNGCKPSLRAPCSNSTPEDFTGIGGIG